MFESYCFCVFQGHGSSSASQYNSGTVYPQQASQPLPSYQQHAPSYQQSTVYQSQPVVSVYSQSYSYTTQYDSNAYAQASGYGHTYLAQTSNSQAQPYGSVTSPQPSASAAYQSYGTPAPAVSSYTSAPVGNVPSRTQTPRQHQSTYQSQPKSAGGLPSVRITGRHSNWH